MCRTFAAAVLVASLFCLTSPATAASLACTVPTSVALNVLPAGCAAVLTNGPITFTGVHGSNGDTHNVEIDSLLMWDMNIGALSAQVSLQGIDHDITAGINTPFSRTITNDFETTPNNTAYLADTGPHTFPIAHFINDFGGGIVFKLNFGEAGRPSQNGLDKVTSSADTTTSPGNFTVTSFFDVFTELSLDGGFNDGSTWTVADNDFLVGSNQAGTGSILQLENNPVPEPATLTLTALGLGGVVTRYRRRRSRG
jgi:hypothetical protein